MLAKLRKALNPKSVAIVGASVDQVSVGFGPVYNLLTSSYRGKIYPINPKYDKVLGLKCYPDLRSVGISPDVVIILLNQFAAVDILEEAGKIGASAAVIVAGGFKEVDDSGRALEQRLRKISENYEMPVIGPNTLGFSSFHIGFHSIFWHFDTFPGNVAVISQSGGVGLTIACSLRTLSSGLSHFIGVGNGAVAGFTDYMLALDEDPNVKVFSLFIEGLTDAREFYEVARNISRKKAVVVYKAGKNEEVSKATMTHTGSLTGEYELYRAMFKQAGIVEVDSAWHAAVVSRALGMLDLPQGNRMCAMTFTAGPSIVAMDRLLDAGWIFPDISDEAKKKIRSVIGEKTPVELQNPIDLTGPGFLPQNYSGVLDVLSNEPFDAFFLVWSFHALIRIPIPELEGFVKCTGKPVVLVILANYDEAQPYLEELSRRGICCYLTPEDGAEALNALLARYKIMNRDGLGQNSTPRRLMG